jgi:hypothetical protein
MSVIFSDPLFPLFLFVVAECCAVFSVYCGYRARYYFKLEGLDSFQTMLFGLECFLGAQLSFECFYLLYFPSIEPLVLAIIK